MLSQLILDTQGNGKLRLSVGNLIEHYCNWNWKDTGTTEKMCTIHDCAKWSGEIKFQIKLGLLKERLCFEPDGILRKLLYCYLKRWQWQKNEKFYFGKKTTPLDLSFNIYKIGSGRNSSVVINEKLWAVRSIPKFPLFYKQMICLLCGPHQIPIFSQKS